MKNPLTPRRTRQRFETRKSHASMLSKFMQHNLMFGSSRHISTFSYHQRQALAVNLTLERRDVTWPINLRFWFLRVADTQTLLAPYLPLKTYIP